MARYMRCAGQLDSNIERWIGQKAASEGASIDLNIFYPPSSGNFHNKSLSAGRSSTVGRMAHGNICEGLLAALLRYIKVLAGELQK
jgi:hypothetical protein